MAIRQGNRGADYFCGYVKIIHLVVDNVINFVYIVFTMKQEQQTKVMVGTRVYPYVREVLEQIAADDDRKLAYVIEKALTEYAGRHARKNGKVKR